MLTEKQKKEILEHLEKAQNPVFFFDNDPDGLCSFLLLQRYIERGKGVAVKSFPDMNKEYFRKVIELNADYIFILDKPVVSKEFWSEVEKVNIPVVWIDHHGVQDEIPMFVNYYDPVLNTPSTNEPVTQLCYQITNRKEDLWIAIIGCISDSVIPDFYSEFMKKYPDLSMKTSIAFDVLYKTEIGKIAKMFSNGLKDKTTNVVNMLKFLMKVKTPYDVLEESSKNYSLHKRYKEIEQKYELLLNKAKEIGKNSEKLLFFKYGGDLSCSGELSNELRYLFPDKEIVVGFTKGSKINLSLRGDNIRKKFLKAIEGIESAKGGGHENAVGGQVSFEDLEEFKQRMEDFKK